MTQPSQTIQAIAVSPGIAIGRVLRLRTHSHLLEPEPHKLAPEEVEAELKRFHTAQEVTRKQLTELRERLRTRLNSQDADIFEAHLLLVDDKMFVGAVEKGIREDHYTADYALYQATEHFAAVFSGMEDEYLRERGADIRDVASRIMDNLSEAHNHEIGMDDRRIIVGNSLSPSETAQLDQGKVLGFAVETGSATCHAAILARSMKLPAVVGIPPELPDSLSAADKLILDGYTGKIIINPDARTEEAYRLKAEAAGALYNKLEQEKTLRPETTDGFMVQLAANLDTPEKIEEVKGSGACGIPLPNGRRPTLKTGAISGISASSRTFCLTLSTPGRLPPRRSSTASRSAPSGTNAPRTGSWWRNGTNR